MFCRFEQLLVFFELGHKAVENFLFDLDGDGFSDILITEDEAWSWYPSQAQDGFGQSQTVRTGRDEEAGPVVVFSDPTQSVFLADMSGDGLTDIGKKLGIPPVVTNDSHYTRESDAQSHDMLLCIQTGKNLTDTDRFRFDGTGYFIKPADQMYAIDRSDLWQEGCRNSQLLIADRVDTTGMFEFVNLMPRFPIPEGFESEDDLFRAEVWQGMERRYPAGYDDQRRQQAEYEIQII